MNLKPITRNMSVREVIHPPVDMGHPRQPPFARTWIMKVGAGIAYSETMWLRTPYRGGKYAHRPNVLCVAITAVAYALTSVLWSVCGKPMHKGEWRLDVCNYCGTTEVDALIHDSVCADCHAEVNA